MRRGGRVGLPAAKLLVVVTLLALALSPSTPSAAAQPKNGIYRIGFLSPGKASAFKLRLAAFRQGMADLGYVEGRTFVMLERYGEGWRDRVPALASELVRLAPDVIVTHGGPQAVTADRMARQTGVTIPLIFAVDPDPVGRGIVASLARPGGNITGLSVSPGDLVPKRLALLRETFPTLTRVAVLYDWRRHDDQLAAIRSAAPLLGLTIMPVKLSTPDELPRAFDTLRRNRPGALDILGYSLEASFRNRIAAFALENRLPTVGTNVRNAEAGYLMTYGNNLDDLYRRAATYVHKILQGAKPADLPVEQPTRFYLTINLQTAKAFGITFPRSILLRADRVIE